MTVRESAASIVLIEGSLQLRRGLVTLQPAAPGFLHGGGRFPGTNFLGNLGVGLIIDALFLQEVIKARSPMFGFGSFRDVISFKRLSAQSKSSPGVFWVVSSMRSALVDSRFARSQLRAMLSAKQEQKWQKTKFLTTIASS